MIKTDSLGNFVWSKTFGGTASDRGYSVIQSIDGGYSITGSFGVTQDIGGGNILEGSMLCIVKTDSSGNLQWSKTYTGSASRPGNGFSIIQLADMSYVVTGEQPVQLASGVYLLKTDADGNRIWSTLESNPSNTFDRGCSVVSSSDDGFVIAGYATSYNINGISFGNGGSDVYLRKTNSQGQVQWSKAYGGTVDDRGLSLVKTSDGGYLISGYTNSFGAGGIDVYLVKTDSAGNLLWTKTFGGTGDDYGCSVFQSSDGGYAIAGYTNSFGAGNNDVYLIKTDLNGNLT